MRYAQRGILLTLIALFCLAGNTEAQQGTQNCSVLHVDSPTNDKPIFSKEPDCAFVWADTYTITALYTGTCEQRNPSGPNTPIGNANVNFQGSGVCALGTSRPPMFSLYSKGSNPLEATAQWQSQNFTLLFYNLLPIMIPGKTTFSDVMKCPATYGTCDRPCFDPKPNSTCTCDLARGNWNCQCPGTPATCPDGSQAACSGGQWTCGSSLLSCPNSPQPNSSCTCPNPGLPWVCACSGVPILCSNGKLQECISHFWVCPQENTCTAPAPNDSCTCDSTGNWQCECQGSPTTCSDGSSAVCFNGGWTCGTVSVCVGSAPNDTCTCDSNGNWQCGCQGSPQTCSDGTPAVCVNGGWTCGTVSICEGTPPACPDGSEGQCESGQWVCPGFCAPSDPTCAGGGGGGGGSGGGGSCGCDPFEDPTCAPDGTAQTTPECSLDSVTVSLDAKQISKLSRPVEPKPERSIGTSRTVSKTLVSHTAMFRSKQK
jgi:hypothetical protein